MVGRLQRTSVMSLHLAEKAAARAAHWGSSRRRWPYSFMVEPQPAALMTMVSTLAASNMAMMVRAMAAAWSSRPEWTMRAPQQGWFSGVITSQPSAARTRAVAALTWEKKTDWTQPASMPTRKRGAVLGATGRGMTRVGIVQVKW